jgi:hypothetical protein
MSKQNLKDVIAEAKTIRETALVQAKLALEEAFTPHLQSILAAKLNELEEDKSEDEALENIAEEAMEETLDLEALLAETEDENLKEAKEEEEKEEEEAGEEAGEEGEKEGEETENEEEVDITELSPEEVEDYIRKIAAEEFEKLEAGQGEEIPGMGDEMGGEEEIDLDAELGEGEEINLDEMKDEDEDKKMEENIESEISEDDINIDELLAEFGLSEEDEKLPEAPKEQGGVKGGMFYEEEDDSEKKMEEELAQALATIDELRSTLQEVNLLNAKLLYMNKVFKGQNLTESQKVQVVKTFDKAESAKEAKLVYESLISTFIKKEEKAPIKESLGFASKASGIIAGSTNRNQVIDSDAQVDRWAKLAGLK